MRLEVLDLALVLLRGGPRLERPEVAAPAGLRVLLARIETVSARRELPDHGVLPEAFMPAACHAGASAALRRRRGAPDRSGAPRRRRARRRRRSRAARLPRPDRRRLPGSAGTR